MVMVDVIKHTYANPSAITTTRHVKNILRIFRLDETEEELKLMMNELK